MRRASDIENQPCAPAGFPFVFVFETVQANCLDEWPRVAAAAAHGCVQSPAVQLELAQAAGHEPVHVGEVDQFVQPVGQQKAAIVSLELDLALLRIRATLVVDELDEGGERVCEQPFLGRSVDPELELGRVLDPAIHTLK
jgi:hypothetical protein